MSLIYSVVLFLGRHRISANFFPRSVAPIKVGRNRSIFFLQPLPQKTENTTFKSGAVLIRLSYLRLKFFVSKGVFIHKITSEGRDFAKAYLKYLLNDSDEGNEESAVITTTESR